MLYNSLSINVPENIEEELIMVPTFDRGIRKTQKEILKKYFPDYDARYHDVFVLRYGKMLEEKQLKTYMKNRGIK